MGVPTFVCKRTGVALEWLFHATPSRLACSAEFTVSDAVLAAELPVSVAGCDLLNGTLCSDGPRASNKTHLTPAWLHQLAQASGKPAPQPNAAAVAYRGFRSAAPEAWQRLWALGTARQRRACTRAAALFQAMGELEAHLPRDAADAWLPHQVHRLAARLP